MNLYTRILALLIMAFLLPACNKKLSVSSWEKKHAPEHFVARSETSKGSFDIESQRSWSPRAVDRYTS